MGTTTETLRFQTLGLEQLSQMGNVLTGINQSLQLIQQGFDHAYRAINQFVQTGSQFEQYNIQFETLLGSVTAAQDQMEALFKFATTTPFELPDVVEAAKSLEAYGIYSERTLRAAGDAASAFGKDFKETALAIAGASTNEMERLKQFGITTAAITEKLGHDMVRNTTEGLQDITQAVVELFEDKAGGGMARMTESLSGSLSMIADKWTEFKKIVADSGVFEHVKDIFGTVLTTVEKLFATGAAQRYGHIVGDTISSAMDEVVYQLFKIVDVLTVFIAILAKTKGYGQAFGFAAKVTGGADVGGGVNWGAVGRAIGASMRGQDWREAAFGVGPAAIGEGMARDYWLRRHGRVPATGADYRGLRGVDISRGGADPSMIPWGYMNRDDTFIGPTMSGRDALGGEFGAAYMGPTGQGGVAGMGFGAGAADMPEGERAEVPSQRPAAEGDEYISQVNDTISALTRNWTGYYSTLERMSQRWMKGEGKVLKDLGNATREFLKSTLQDFIQMQTQRVVLKQLEALADALLFGAFNPAAAAGALAAAAGYAALGGVASGMVASIGPDEGGGYDGGGGGYEAQDTGGTRTLSRTAGIKTQSLNININVAHYGATMYGGASGVREFWEEHLEPLVMEAVEMGRVG